MANQCFTNAFFPFNRFSERLYLLATVGMILKNHNSNFKQNCPLRNSGLDQYLKANNRLFVLFQPQTWRE